MYKPATFRPTKNDNTVLEMIATDYPIHADSLIELIRMALDTYPKYKTEIQELRQRIEALEANQAR